MQPPYRLPSPPFPQLEASRSDAATAVYLYKQMEEPELKPWEKPLSPPMSAEKRKALRLGLARAYLLRGQAEMRLCDFWGALRTFQLGCKAWPKDKELREHWYVQGRERKRNDESNGGRGGEGRGEEESG